MPRTSRRIDGMRVAEFGPRGTGRRRLLVEEILGGSKTATTGLVVHYAAEGVEIPAVGERFVVVDDRDEPAGIIETTEVRLIRAGEVDLDFVRAEGLGLDSVAAWREEHARVFAPGIPQYREYTGDPTWTFDDDTEIIAERFRLVRMS
jgi:uncharacterized protein YhfF